MFFGGWKPLFLWVTEMVWPSWSWFKPVTNDLFIAGSNSRVQTIIDGQGIALWGRVVNPEGNPKHLQYRLNNWLYEYGYYVRVSGAAQKRGGDVYRLAEARVCDCIKRNWFRCTYNKLFPSLRLGCSCHEHESKCFFDVWVVLIWDVIANLGVNSN